MVWDSSVVDRVGSMSGVIGRWRAADLSATDGAVISSWPSKGAGSEIALSGGPTYRAAGTTNGRPAVRFDGVDDYGTANLATAVDTVTWGLVVTTSVQNVEMQLISHVAGPEIIQGANNTAYYWAGSDGAGSAPQTFANTPKVWTARDRDGDRFRNLTRLDPLEGA